MQCNIDAKGKAVRMIYGIIFVIVGVLLMIFWAASMWTWIISILVALGGAFAIFESRAGWCVVRAMGWKTRI